jgi:hypothetical protein
MARPFNFPDPRNVTIGNPTFLASKELVINLYNQGNPENTVSNYCQRAKDWFIDEATSLGWTNALEAGNGLGILLHFKIAFPSGSGLPALN